MINILPRLEKEFSWLGSRSGTETDYHEFCERNNIETIFRNDFPMGVWVMAAGRNFILLNSSLSGWLLRYVMFHELAHYLFHSPTNSNFAIEFCDKHIRRKNHIEAEQAAALILLPKSELENVIDNGIEGIYPELESLVAVRLDLIEQLGK